MLFFGKKTLDKKSGREKEEIKKPSNKKVSTKTLSGFMELLPAEQIVFNKMFDTIREAYELFGFIPLDTPILERAEVLLAKAGGETEKQIYQFKKGDTDLAMRFDLTVPLARFVAENWRELAFPFKRYAMGKVYRGERAQAGRFREFYQCDIDVIGDEKLDIRFDAEIPSIIYTIFNKLGFDKFTIQINNRKLFNSLFSGLGVSEKSAKIMQSIDRLEKIGAEKVEEELSELKLTKDVIEQILNFINLKGSNSKILQGLKDLSIENDEFKKGIEELEMVVNLIQQFGVPESNFRIDLTIARGLDYYTGTVYETRLDEYPEIGSVCSGGRYDNLASQYTDKKLPGVGISIGLTRLFDQLKKKEVIKTGSATLTQVLIIPMTENPELSIELASVLRENGIATEIYFTQDKMKKRLGYADKLGIPYTVIIGEDEIIKDVYTLKDMITGEQKELKREELLEKMRKGF
ncbi:histidine--tRNA ligase [Patescibacteria group bacterium]|nr:histidine--tRNA ligase [Patescibacteria group bacterium]